MPKKVEKRTHSEAFPEQEPEQQENNEVHLSPASRWQESGRVGLNWNGLYPIDL